MLLGSIPANLLRLAIFLRFSSSAGLWSTNFSVERFAPHNFTTSRGHSTVRKCFDAIAVLSLVGGLVSPSLGHCTVSTFGLQRTAKRVRELLKVSPAAPANVITLLSRRYRTRVTFAGQSGLLRRPPRSRFGVKENLNDPPREQRIGWISSMFIRDNPRSSGPFSPPIQ